MTPIYPRADRGRKGVCGGLCIEPARHGDKRRPTASPRGPHVHRHRNRAPRRQAGPHRRAPKTGWSRWPREFNAILGFIEQLQEVDVDGVEPMVSVTPQRLKRRADVVTDGDQAGAVLANAPDAREGFFAVPKVVE